ncbi:leucyl/phenylalanyl-tRNA--protein transferase [Ascidiimonas sp. W6]|uniref:leucyl/phenylalanyl-tRNA--protein transferase n=1 Tax=Ascidiimonas meishanensis TaxID=3128903 RepID=UPI0030ED2B83
MFYLTDKLEFPPAQSASEDGIVAVGGDLSPERLILAYNSGIFPWFEEEDIILWWSPDPRMVLYPEKLKISSSMRKILKNNYFSITYNQNFKEVIQNCAAVKRSGQAGTWITESMIKGYTALHEMGLAVSVEVWKDKELVGGLYGIDLGHVFCGESMFSKVSNASKAAFISLVKRLNGKGYKLVDCQVYTEHLESLGAEEIARSEFLEILNGKDQRR